MPRQSTLTEDTDRRRPRTLFTEFGGINLNNYDSYRLLPDGTVQVFTGATHYVLNRQDSYQFLRMVGDTRSGQLEDRKKIP